MSRVLMKPRLLLWIIFYQQLARLHVASGLPSVGLNCAIHGVRIQLESVNY